jgi:hypothetical protein
MQVKEVDRKGEVKVDEGGWAAGKISPGVAKILRPALFVLSLYSRDGATSQLADVFWLREREHFYVLLVGTFLQQQSVYETPTVW